MNKFIVLFFLLLFSQCSKDKDRPDKLIIENGVIVSQPWLWSISLTEHDFSEANLEQTICFNGGILMGAENSEGNEYLLFVDLNTGQKIWKTNYYIESDFFQLQEAYQYDNILIERENNTLFSLNLATGKYEWIKELNDNAYGWLTGIDSLFFLFKEIPYPSKLKYKVFAAFYANISDGVEQPLVIPNLAELPEPDSLKTYIIGWFRFIQPYKDTRSGNIMLLCYYTKNYALASSEEMESQSYLGLYNFSDRNWVYEGIKLGKFNSLEGFTPTIIGDKFYHTLSEGVCECRDLNIGKVIWRQERNHQYSYKGFVIADGKMIVMDNLGRKLIALDINSGNEVWSTEVGGSPSLMSVLNGVVYFVSGGNSDLYAVEISTGKILWKICSPDEKIDMYDSFKDECKLIPGKDGEKGKIIVSSFTHAYCYEAAR
jgi:outer membrane protein assembly factor BamB